LTDGVKKDEQQQQKFLLLLKLNISVEYTDIKGTSTSTTVLLLLNQRESLEHQTDLEDSDS
jgi:hypothetical protein